MSQEVNYQNTTYEYIEINLIEKKPATNVYEVVNSKSGDPIGTIRWYANWRQYCFFPDNECVFSKGCMTDINDFITKLMDARKPNITKFARSEDHD